MRTFKTINDIKDFLRLTEAEDNAEPKSDDQTSLKSGDISTDQIIEKLNTIRSGKSFKDSQIKESLQEYIDSLKKPEKVALFAFLKGVAQIVTGEVSGDKAIEPSDPVPAVSMKKGVVKKVIKPTVVKKRVEKKEEDTTPPTPIKPKK